MKQIKYFFFLPASFILLALACNKSSSSNTDEQNGNWVTGSEGSLSIRYQCVSFVINDTAYEGFGYNGTKRYNDLWRFDGSNWIQMASTPSTDTARSSAVGFAVNGKGYITTGTDGYYKINSTWEFNPTLNQWTKKADFGGNPRYSATAFAIGNKGYVTCGFDDENYYKDIWEYDPSLDKWTQKNSLGGFKRRNATAFVYNNQAYILTGLGGGGTNVNDFWKYNPVSDSCTALRKIANISSDSYDDDYSDIVRNSAVSFVLGNKAYLTLGINGGYTKKTWEYDFATDAWVRKTPFERSEREGAVAFTIKGRAFVSTGKSGSYYFDDVEEFLPSVTLNTVD
jgi:N-acetylneuraminic acid mutarotase